MLPEDDDLFRDPIPTPLGRELRALPRPAHAADITRVLDESMLRARLFGAAAAGSLQAIFADVEAPIVAHLFSVAHDAIVAASEQGHAPKAQVAAGVTAVKAFVCNIALARGMEAHDADAIGFVVANRAASAMTTS